VVHEAGPRELERLFHQGVLSRRQLLQGLVTIGLSAASIEILFGSETGTVEAQVPRPRYLVLIVLDGFRPDYLQLAEMPAYRALAAAGTVYERAWVGQLESETPVGHATLSTGALPRNHGIIGFEWRDPASLLEVKDGWEQGAALGQVGRDLAAHHVTSIPEAVKRANPGAVVVSLSSEKVYAADAMSARAADYVLYHQFSGNRLSPAALPGQSPDVDFFAGKHLTLPLPLAHFTDWDYLSSQLALAALARYRPEVLMVNLPGSDVYGHKYGGPNSPGIMTHVVAGQDRAIGRIVRAYQSAGIYDQTLFVVTADHAMVPNTHAVGPDQIGAAVRQAGARVQFHTGGSGKYIYLQPPFRTRAKEVAQAVAKIPGVVAGYYRTASGDYVLAAGSIPAELDAAYRGLIATFTGPTAPDVVAPYRENTIGTTLPQLYGNHGGLSWGVQHVPLLLTGPGVRAGIRSHAPARLVDVAPTVLRLLGLTWPGLDGLVLADALVDANAAEVAAQRLLTRSLGLHQEALIERSLSDVAGDRQTHAAPPPPISAQP